ncbi:hypothetical protein [Chromobacterium sphagni]|uniref:hypothetical protein n=1 Tax=Chromobacterium sphagni TaxID=1903179 RepID=UPI0019D36ECD|nr:hypothetical protein [Chromobacterium sphagni]
MGGRFDWPRRMGGWLAAGCLGGCALHGIAFVAPGETVKPWSSSSAGITYQYMHVYDGELPYAAGLADGYCGGLGRRAVLARVGKQAADRSLAIFKCQ